MKAKLKETGDIVEVIAYQNDNLQYGNEKAGEWISARINGVPMVFQEFEIIPDTPTAEPTFDQRRYELAKAAMQGVLANPSYCGLELDKSGGYQVIIYAIEMADLMLSELEKR